MDTGAHESEERLELYVLGRLADSEVVVVEEHLFLCDECRDQLENISVYAVAMREELRHPEPVKSRGWLDAFAMPSFAMPSLGRSGWAVGAAFAALLLALGIYIGGSRPLAPLASLTLTAMRSGSAQSVGGSRALDLTIADAPAEGGPFVVEVVDASGGKIWTGAASASAAPAGSSLPAPLHATVTRRLSPGGYFVRLYTSSGKMAHEYAFRVT